MAIKILHTGDWHYGVHPLNITKNGFNQRELDFYNAGDTIIDYAINVAKPDIFVLTGDTFHVTRPEPHTVKRLLIGLRKLINAGIEVIIIGGNHDTPARPGKESPLLLLDNILDLHLFLEQESKEIAGIKFHALPYRTLSKDAMIPFNYDDTLPNVFIGHATVPSDIIPSHIKDLVEIPIDIVDAPEHLVSLLGHIHIHAKVTEKSYYCGSIEMINFGEIKNTPAIWIHEIESKEKVKTTSIPLHEMGNSKVPRKTMDFDLEVEGYDNDDIDKEIINKLDNVIPGSLVRISISNADRTLRNSSYINKWRKRAYEKKCLHFELKIKTQALDNFDDQINILENNEGESITTIISMENEWKNFLEEKNKVEYLNTGLKYIRGEKNDN